MWTDKKHSLYLENLEASFVKQLHQSINFLAQCSNQDEGNKHLISGRDTSEQLINCNINDPLPRVSLHSSSHFILAEGIGQNFADEDDEINSDTKSRVKRL